MAHPWNYPPERFDYQAAAGALVLLSQGKDCSQLLDAIQPGETTVLPKSPLVPPALVNVTDDYVLVAVAGTQNYAQWILHFLGSNQTPNTQYPGGVNTYFAATADSLLAALADYEALLATRRLICIGHSFGAAVVQLVATKWQSLATRGVVTICYGSPRVGDEVFAEAAIYPPFRVQTFGDPVPASPPTTWAGTGTPWTGFFGLTSATYVHGGVVQPLADSGQLGGTDNTMSFQNAIGVIVAGKFDPHAIEFYLKLLEMIFEPPAGTTWAEPATVEQILSFEAINFTPVFFPDGGNVANIQGIMYFRTTERVWGWGESFVGSTDITTMLNTKLPTLALTRALTLTNSCEIFAYKASDVTVPRARNQSKSVILDVPIPGKGSGTSIKDLDNTQTNILVDAIDYEVLSGTGSRRIFPFRGIPDNWVQGSVRTGKGIGQDKNFLKLFTDATGLGLGFKIYDRANPQKPITNIAPDPVTKLLKITFAGHGLVDRQLVQIRSLKPNPMVNGRWRVQVNDANTFSLVGSDKFNVTANGVGTWQLFANALDPIASASFNACSTRKMGKVFGQRRGKQSAKLLHH